MKNIVITTLVASAVLAGPALAQDKTMQKPAADQAGQMKTPPAGTAMPSSADAMGGMTMADTATAKIKFVTARPADVTSSKLVGKNLYNNKNETVGEIEDLVIDNGKMQPAGLHEVERAKDSAHVVDVVGVAVVGGEDRDDRVQS